MIIIFSSVTGAIATYYLQKQGVSVVIASCIIGLAGAFVAHLLKMPEIAITVFAGSFVGMTNPAIGGYLVVTVAGILCGVVYNLSENIFVGVGGRLGAMAFISTLFSLGFIQLIKKTNIIAILTQEHQQSSDVKKE